MPVMASRVWITSLMDDKVILIAVGASLLTPPLSETLSRETFLFFFLQIRVTNATNEMTRAPARQNATTGHPFFQHRIKIWSRVVWYLIRPLGGKEVGIFVHRHTILGVYRIRSSLDGDICLVCPVCKSVSRDTETHHGIETQKSRMWIRNNKHYKKALRTSI